MNRVTRLLVALFASVDVVCVTSAQTPSSARSSSEVITGFFESGDYIAAEREARSWVRSATSREGEESLEVVKASSLLVQALIRNGETGPPSTLALAERVVKLTAKLSGPASLDSAGSLHDLANVCIERGEFKRALSLHQQSLSIREKHLGPNARAVADSLDRLRRSREPG
jgi:hypothetical protein